MDIDQYRAECTNVSCPACQATAGQPCFKLDASGNAIDNEPAPYVHDDRSLVHFSTVLAFLAPSPDRPVPSGACPGTLTYACSLAPEHGGNHRPGKLLNAT